MSALQGAMARAFLRPFYFKFAATRDDAGVPNVVPILSARMMDSNTIAFVRFMAWKTAKNLEANGRVAFGCLGPWGRAYLARGEFLGWETTGPLVEKFATEPMYRYNAYMGATHVGVVRVRETMTLPAGVIAPVLAARRAAGNGTATGPMAPPVREKWRRLLTAKCLGLVDEAGEPLPIASPGLAAESASRLSFPWPRDLNHPLCRLRPGVLLAASVFALDPVAYQVKGRFSGLSADGRRGTMAVSEVFSAAPPTPGKRIFPPER